MNKHNLEVLGIVGLRSGSKGVPGKNIRNLLNKPLAAWILETALSTKFINRLVVSTDSEQYANIAKEYGAEVPYLRPKDLASDFSPEIEFIKHMLNWLEENKNYRPDIIVRMLATSPMQEADESYLRRKVINICEH